MNPDCLYNRAVRMNLLPEGTPEHDAAVAEFMNAFMSARLLTRLAVGFRVGIWRWRHRHTDWSTG